MKAPLAPSAEMALPPVAGVNWGALTVMAGLVLAVLLASDTSLAVSVKLPLVLKETIKDRVPFKSGELAGKVALVVEEVIPTLSLTLVSTFQLASTALTVTLNAVLASCATGVPVLPLAVPAAAVSPGTNSCSLVNGPALTRTFDEIALLKLPLLKTIVIVCANG